MFAAVVGLLQLSELKEDVDTLTRTNAEGLLGHHDDNVSGPVALQPHATASSSSSGVGHSTENRNNSVRRVQDGSASFHNSTAAVSVGGGGTTRHSDRGDQRSAPKRLLDIEQDTIDDLAPMSGARSKAEEGRRGLGAHNAMVGKYGHVRG